jgi:Nucleotide modification associated domain 3
VKIILSRKGTDSGLSSGKMPSPILPCGCLCPVPIPYSRSDVRYSDIRFGNKTIADICNGLKSDWENNLIHLDPDLCFESLLAEKRPKDWRPAFGQSGAAASHLNNQSVGSGDLFVFFGWFRKTEWAANGKLRFCPSDKHGRHVIFGWLEIERVVAVEDAPFEGELEFLNEHAHVKFVKEHPNQIYIGSKSGLGSGTFAKECAELVLTKGTGKRSIWRLPAAFESVYQQADLTFHKNSQRWQQEEGEICLTTVSRGQEFVLDGAKHPAARQYLLDLIKSAGRDFGNCSHQPHAQRRTFGSAKGEFTVPDDFNDPLPKEIEDLFYE